MKTDHKFYSYQYLYKISSTSSLFIIKMISLFLNSLSEYIADLEKQKVKKDLTELQRVVHKLKPSVLSLEVRGAREALLAIDTAGEWNMQAESGLDKLLEVFKIIKPMMEQDLAKLNEEEHKS